MVDLCGNPRRGALASFTPPPPQGADGATVTLESCDALGLIVVRGKSADAAFMQACERTFGPPLPVRPSTFATLGERRALWVSPDEWWLLCPVHDKDAVSSALSAALEAAGVHCSQVLDNSGTLAAMRLSGSEHLTVLRHLTSADVQALQPGDCPGASLAGASVTLVCESPQAVLLLFRRSYADWVARMLLRSARPYLGQRASVEPGASRSRDSHG